MVPLVVPEVKARVVRVMAPVDNGAVDKARVVRVVVLFPVVVVAVVVEFPEVEVVAVPEVVVAVPVVVLTGAVTLNETEAMQEVLPSAL